MTTEGDSRKALFQFVLVFILLVIGIATAGHFYYENQKNAIRQQKYGELSAITDLKVNAISLWLRERVADAQVIMRNPFFAPEILQWTKNPADTRRREEITSWIKSIQEGYDYGRVSLVDPAGALLMAYPQKEQLSSTQLANALQAVRLKRPVVSNLYRSETTNLIHLDVFVPIFNLREQNRPIVTILISHIDPYKYFYPLIQSWPTPSRTSESLLVCREGDEVVYLNELRHRKDSALSLRFPLSQANLPAAMAAGGHEGVLEGVDYRGVPVLASIRAIPGFQWFLVAKTDQEEIYGPIHERAQAILLVVSLLIAGAGVGLALIWNYQHKLTLRTARDQLELQVRERTSDLVGLNEALQREVAERKDAEEKTSKAKAMLQTVFNGISDPLIMVEKDLSIKMLNEASYRYFQISNNQEALGKTCQDLTLGKCAPCEDCAIREAILEGRSVVFERPCPVDPERIEQVTVYPAEESVSGFSGAILRISDITEGKNIERQLMRADRLSSLGLLSAGIAHEIRNPLAGISLFTDLLADEERFNRTNDELNLLGEIKSGIGRINGIVKRVLDFSKQSQNSLSNLELSPLIEDTVNLWRSRMKSEQVEITLSLEEKLPDIQGDYIEIQQVINNLVQNAIEAMAEGGSLKITAREGVFSFDKMRRAVTIRIQDSGVGIPSAQQQNIFNPFFTTKPAGTGLGLVISDRIVRRHGGIIAVESVPSGGTTFRIELPVAPKN